MPSITPGLQATALQQAPGDLINSLRLVSDGKSISLATMTGSLDGLHDVSLRVLESNTLGAPQSVGKMPSPFGTPFWDMAFTPKGLSKVWTMPGSAICPLGYQAPGKEEITLTGHYPSGVFQHPRFVRGNPTLAVTANALQPVGEALVFFQDGMEGGQSQYRLLPAAGPGTLLDGLLIKQGEGYLLLARYAAPELGVASRTDLRGESVPPGVLRGLRLNTNFQPVDSVFYPLGNSAVFDFDADVSGERIYLLATTVQGYQVAAGVLREDTWYWTRASEVLMPGTTLFAPAILGKARSTAMIFLATTESGVRKLLHGRILIEEP